MSKQYLLAIDQGTTSSRAIVFDTKGTIVSVAQKEFPQHFPHDGWVEHDPEDMWQGTVNVCREALFKKNIKPTSILSIGITNQRETTVVWNRQSGKSIYNAIVWQDRRTADFCRQLHHPHTMSNIQGKTGLLLDPYFSATKIRWILDHVKGAKTLAKKGQLAFGTVDTFLLWRLTGGKVHATDATNASRTMLFNIHQQDWDDDLLKLFNIPRSLLPEVKDCSADYGCAEAEILGAEVPIGGIAGDQQAATIGQACFKPGMMKSTYGTGAFMLLNTGHHPVMSQNRLLTTVAYRLKNKPTYALEGSVFIAGAAMQWLRDKIHLVHHAADSDALARSVPSTEGVYFIPAFTGLGAPYWQPDVRGAILGLTRDTGIAHITRAALEAVCYQTRDLLDCMLADGAKKCRQLRIDGGMVSNDWLCQHLADTLGVTVNRPKIIETTALGAACLAGLQAGLFASLDDMAQVWHSDQEFKPTVSAQQRNKAYAGWQQAVQRLL